MLKSRVLLPTGLTASGVWTDAGITPHLVRSNNYPLRIQTLKFWCP